MSIVKTFAVGDGDMYYIKHNSDNFSIIDCSLRLDAAARHWLAFQTFVLTGSPQ